jgi:hypothetical protein
MSARSRAAPWFGTLGERLDLAETEARIEDDLRSMRFGPGAAMPEAIRREWAIANADVWRGSLSFWLPGFIAWSRGAIRYPPEAADAEVGSIHYAGNRHFRAPGWGLA